MSIVELRMLKDCCEKRAQAHEKGTLEALPRMLLPILSTARNDFHFVTDSLVCDMKNN